MMPENWKPVPGWEDLYEVSDHGRVRSHDRVIHEVDRRGFARSRRKKGRILSLNLTGNGYPFVGLFRAGHGKQIMVHRLVASAFLPNPDGKPEVNHKDCDKTNNHDSNLEWSTPRENSQHAHDSGRWRADVVRGEDSPTAILTEAQVRAIRSDYVPRRFGYREIAAKYGIAEITAYRIVKRRAWAHVD